MIGRERESVEEGRVEGGRVAERNKRGRDGPRHGRREGKRGGKKRGSKGGGKLQGRYPDEGTGQVHDREPGRSRVTI